MFIVVTASLARLAPPRPPCESRCVLRRGVFPSIPFHLIQSGNDLSRTFGWGPGFTRSMLKPKFLERVQEAPPARLDRCVCVFQGQTKVWLFRVFWFCLVADLFTTAHILLAGGASRVFSVVWWNCFRSLPMNFSHLFTQDMSRSFKCPFSGSRMLIHTDPHIMK